MAAAKNALTIQDARRALDHGDCARAEAISAELVGVEPHNAAAWHLLGLARQRQGSNAKALEALGKAAALERDAPRFHHDLGNALIDEGKADRAISSFRRALRLDDSLAEVHNDLGAAYFEKRWYAEAVECFRKAIERDPTHAVAHANLGAALRALGQLSESRRAYQRALWLKIRRWFPLGAKTSSPQKSAPRARPELQRIRAALQGGRAKEAAALAAGALREHPDDPEVLHLSAVAYEDNRDYDSALRCVRAALERRRDFTEYHITLARILVRIGDQDGALQAATTALKLEPGSAAIHATISGIFHPWREDLAEQAARHAIELDPQVHLAHANLAAALWGQGRLDEAEPAAREAIRLKGDEVGYRTNLGLILKDLDRVEEARALYRDLLAEVPEHGKVCLDVGTLAVETEGDLETARTMYRRAQKSADEPRAYMAEALVDFLEGRFGEAWPNYEVRKQLGDQRGHHEQFGFVPDWKGEPVGPGELLVYGEQGLGDEVMFGSMFGELAQRVPGFTLLCDPRLAALFARSFPSLNVIGEPRDSQRARVAALKQLRYKIAAGSLGALFRRSSADFPRREGYLVPDPARVAAWRERLGQHPGRRKIGISWRGGVQKTGRSRRSLSLEELQPLLALPDIAWISLQYNEASVSPLHDYRSATKDMDELASLVQALDAVVSVCNTTVHVAGAVGKNTLVMAPFVPEWRYGMRDERMIWYSSVRVLRQQRYGDWSGVLEAVRERLLA